VSATGKIPLPRPRRCGMDGFYYRRSGRRDKDGYFWFEGRTKEIIIRDGFAIGAPQEVEEGDLAITRRAGGSGDRDCPIRSMAKSNRVRVVAEGAAASEHELIELRARGWRITECRREFCFCPSCPRHHRESYSAGFSSKWRILEDRPLARAVPEPSAASPQAEPRASANRDASAVGTLAAICTPDQSARVGTAESSRCAEKIAATKEPARRPAAAN